MSTLSLMEPRRWLGPWGVVGLACLAAVAVGPRVTRSQEPDPAEADQAAEPATTSGEAERDADDAPDAVEPPSSPATAPTPAEATWPPAPGSAKAAKDPMSYGLWVLVPAVVAILLAIVTRQVIPALVVGIFAGAFMYVPCLAPGDAYADLSAVVAGIRLAAEQYVLGAIIDESDGHAHAKIMMFTLLIGFVVGVMGRNGGTAGMVRVVVGRTESPRRGALTAWLAGLVVFFDDYANTMIVGPTMRSVFDKLKLSRAKLAYIVDSTAAPVASIALIGTWVGAEIGFIESGLNQLAEKGSPLLDAQGNALSGMQVFISSLAYRFYPLLALFLVFLVALTGRDFGPMKRSESKAISRIDRDATRIVPSGRDEEQPPPRWWLGLVPIAVLVGITVWVLVVSGYRAEGTIAKMHAVAADGSSKWAQTPWWQKAATVVSNADAYLSIFYGAVLSAIVVVVLTLVARTSSTRKAVEAGLEGMSRMFPAIVILILAWALSAVLQDLQLGEVARARMEEWAFPVQWLPLGVFCSAAVISFATGTSWGTLGILCPVTVTIAAGLIGPLDPAEGMSLFYATVGSVLAGAIFGDHCSPISDTTVLSSIASECPHEEHVWTQIPYALVTAVAAMGLGDVLCSVYKQPWYLGLGAGALFLLLVVWIVGRRATPSLEYAEA